MAGDATPAQLAAFAVLLRAKGETPEELAGLVTHDARPGRAGGVDGPAVDVVGTGADRANTVNISTMAALVVAGIGPAPSSSTATGPRRRRAAPPTCSRNSAWSIDLPAAGVPQTVADVGIGFCFAPVFHAGMRHAGPTRAASSACRRSSTSSGRSPTPPECALRRSAARTPGWRR